MKISITVTTGNGKEIKKEFEGVSEAVTYLSNTVHKMAVNEAEAESKRQDAQQLQDSEEAKRQL